MPQFEALERGRMALQSSTPGIVLMCNLQRGRKTRPSANDFREAKIIVLCQLS
jgi:hypothetical protein